MNMTWKSLTEDEYLRLCECRSRKADIMPIAKAYILERGYEPEQALEVTLEHLGANSQMFDLTKDEWVDGIYALEIYYRNLYEAVP